MEDGSSQLDAAAVCAGGKITCKFSREKDTLTPSQNSLAAP